MASIERTAYPRFRKRLSEQELHTCYEITSQERRFIRLHANGADQRLTLLVLLKTRQHLGYFPALEQVPESISKHLAQQFGLPAEARLPREQHLKKTLYRYRKAIRAYLGSRLYADGGAKHIEQSILKAALTMSDPADLINVAVEALVKAGFELPAFSTLDRLVGHLRQRIHQQLYRQLSARLTPEQEQILDGLLVVRPGEQVTDFNRFKQTPGPPTLHHITSWIRRLDWLGTIIDPASLLEGITHTKIRQFAAEASAHEISDMRGLRLEGRGHTLLLCLLHQAQVQTRDALVEMFLRRMKRTRSKAEEQLRLMQEQHRQQEEALIALLGQVLERAQERAEAPDEAFGRDVRHVLTHHGGVEALMHQYEAVSAYHQNNYLPLLWPIHARNRATLFRLLELLEIQSATQDAHLPQALGFVQHYRHARRDYLPFEAAQDDGLDLDFASQRWQAFVQVEVDGRVMLKRRALEVCVLTYVAEALRRGDLYVVGSEAYADYRTQLLPWATCQDRLAAYCQTLSLPGTGEALVASLREQLTVTAQQVDASFADNTELTIDAEGTPHLKRQRASPLPEGLGTFEQAVRTRMPERHLIDILKHVQYWAGYTRHFGPPSGSDPKLAESSERYLFTVFGYGCNLGASQTARHGPPSINRHTLRRINAQHVNQTKLEAALNDIIAEYTRFELPPFWGGGRVAIADGTHMELRQNNLLATQHIRYRSYGGIAYHHISDTYIALFSHFIACGVWEAVYILDGLLKNQSALQADTVHADTHGQSEPVFGLAHLLGIKLLPRMRTWNDVAFYRPSRATSYGHIDALFTQVVDWKLIETHWEDMMQVVLSIQAGKVLPSMLLRKLGTHNKKNKLYRAFRELGRVERTLFLLRYISEPAFRHRLRAETTKVESYHEFLDWISFGGPVLKSGDPVEQEKQIKYMNLVANAVMLSNVVDLTEVLNTMTSEGYVVTRELVGRLSPYLREHIRRFGQYVLDMEVKPEPLEPRRVRLAERAMLK